jgi:hypothetical protein
MSRLRDELVRATGRALGVYARGDGLVQSARRRTEAGLARLLERVLTEEERTAVSIAVYASLGQETHADRPLFAWESVFFADVLPKPPARVLVAGAGAGREVRALLELGYEVDAFEPAATSHAALRARFGSRGRMLRGAYADLSERGALGALHTTTYDAVLCGWTSFGHVIGASTREATLRTLTKLAPEGPVLTSFWLGPLPHDRFTAHAGFMHCFAEDELHALARAVSRDLHLETSAAFPHAAFMPRVQRAPSPSPRGRARSPSG